jgi:CRP/FNR family transcriptional regulator
VSIGTAATEVTASPVGKDAVSPDTNEGVPGKNDGGLARLLEALAAEEAERAAAILTGCRTARVASGEPHFRTSLPAAALFVVDEDFAVLRIVRAEATRSVITCVAGPGRVLLPPIDDEVLFGLVDSRLIAVSDEALEELLALPGAARGLVEQMTATLLQNQEAIANFVDTRHLERVRRTLLQLARLYGRVGHDGIRIDFPVSHTVLAEMIGSSRETVTRALDELQRMRFVARRGHSYRLLISPEDVFAPPPDDADIEV